MREYKFRGKKQIWDDEKLKNVFYKLERELGRLPYKEEWKKCDYTPSDMPLRMLYGNWTNFLIACERNPRQPKISSLCRKNSIISRKDKKGGNNKGGYIKDKNGYIQVWFPEHPNAKMGGYIHEHRLVMSEHLGRELKTYENIHHIDGNRENNNISNLEIWTTQQPSGQRLEDKIEWAISFLKEYGFEVVGNIHNEVIK